ncbi:MAG: DUF420 domain-containing protein [Verrucomicrobiota bacterium]
MKPDRAAWLSRPANLPLARKLGIAAWILTAVVFGLVGLMSGPKIPLPDAWSFAFLPPVHAVLNSLVAVFLLAAVWAVKKGCIALHRNLICSAMGLSVLFLLCYVAYHFTTVETKFGGTGWSRTAYFFLLISHIVLAGISLPLILFTFISGWTNQFEKHRRLAKRVFPLWLYVAVTGPLCYLMLRPYYPQ